MQAAVRKIRMESSGGLRRGRPWRFWQAALALLVALAGPALGQDKPQAGLRMAALEVVASSGVHHFTVEMALGDEERSIGLMHRRELASDGGMLFDFGRDEIVTMWMKNTILSLDMVFIKADGTVAHVVERTTPFSLATISSRVEVRAVLEVAAGTVKRLGVKQGDRIRNVIFGNL